jgi:cyclase
VTFDERLNLYVDDLGVELIFMGPAHTTNDIVAWIPERNVLFAGDCVQQGTPFVRGLNRRLAGGRWAAARWSATIVPGHGSVCGPEVIDEVADYLRFVRETAREGFEEGLTPLAASQRTDLGRFGELLDRERLVGNLHRAYSELRGEPLGTVLDLGAVVPDMITYNGGQMPRCLA